MVWSPELVRAEVDRRHEAARNHAFVRQLRESRGTRPSWWRRLRPHQEPDKDNVETDPAA
ncbi:MAG TPA: hypothetical protein VFV67_28360 [Actinophytocola sp.]|uniref:hypothetical protein n=1 Tax=Actinophytocola sp. TaxID=1872138 RepID=UPI002DBD656D|nr:hypothetical protein [Actinophytocola sp.]HEU5474578.1 hypothetical protein [Actinophytocola sp.]